MTKSSSLSKKQKRSLTIANDPVYKLISSIPIPVVWIIVLAANASVYIIVGLVIDYLYPNAKDLLGIHDAAEIINGISVWAVFTPVVWAYYRWLPESALRGCASIEKLGIISSTGEKTKLTSILHQRLSSKWVHALATLGVLAWLLYMLFVSIPAQNSQLQLVDFWYYTKWSMGLFFMFHVPTNYVLYVFMFRTLATAITVNQYFRRPDSIIKLYPLHPDKCGGMGDVGLLLSNMLLIVALVPIWWIIATHFMGFLVSGGSPMIGPFGVLALYTVIVPVTLFFLLWQPHRAMRFFKGQQLLDISKRLLELQDQLARKIQEKDWDELKNLQDKYRQLQDIYSTLDKQIPIWPISLPTLRNFGAITGSPIVAGLIAFGVELLGKYTH